MSCRIRAVEHREYAVGLAGGHAGLLDRILLNDTRTGNAHRVRKKLSFFVMYRSSANFQFSFFPAETL